MLVANIYGSVFLSPTALCDTSLAGSVTFLHLCTVYAHCCVHVVKYMLRSCVPLFTFNVVLVCERVWPPQPIFVLPSTYMCLVLSFVCSTLSLLDIIISQSVLILFFRRQHGIGRVAVNDAMQAVCLSREESLMTNRITTANVILKNASG